MLTQPYPWTQSFLPVQINQDQKVTIHIYPPKAHEYML